MNTTRYDDQGATEPPYRSAAAALIWGALIAAFAFAGATLRDEPTQMANAAPAQSPMVKETTTASTTALNAPTASDPALRDAAIVVHEVLDPVGVGLSSNTTR
jgi:hypothetical protein